jgi:hypothetical protein
MSQGIGDLAQALIQRRQFQQQQNQQDIANAENGVYRGEAPRGALNVTTPDFQISDRPGYDDGTASGAVLPGQGNGPQVTQSGGFSSTNTGSRPVPGGISALNPMTDALMQGRAQSQAGGGVTSSFNGPAGKGLVDTQRYQQIKTPGGDQFFLDREQTPDAQGLRRSILSGEMGFNKAMTVQMLHNSGMLERQGMVDDSYGPDGQRTQGKLATQGAAERFTTGQKQQQYGYVDEQGQYHPGTVATGKVYTAAQELPGKTQSAIDINNARPHYPSAGRAAGRSGLGASDPTTRQFNAVGKQITQTNAAINQTTRQMNAPATMLDSTATSSLQQRLMSQQHKRDSLMTVGDSLSGVMQHPLSASGIPRTGAEADALQLPTHGAQTPMTGNRTNQNVRTTSDRIPSASTDASNANHTGRTASNPLKEASQYKSFVSDIQNDTTLAPQEKNIRLAKAAEIYKQRLATLKTPR